MHHNQNRAIGAASRLGSRSTTDLDVELIEVSVGRFGKVKESSYPVRIVDVGLLGAGVDLGRRHHYQAGGRMILRRGPAEAVCIVRRVAGKICGVEFVKSNRAWQELVAAHRTGPHGALDRTAAGGG